MNIDKMILKLSAMMLEIASDTFSNFSCDDLDLPLEFLPVIQKMLTEGDHPEDNPNVNFEEGKVYTGACEVMSFCQAQLERMVKQ